MSPADYKAHREKLGLTQAGLAALLGVPRESISRRESGLQKITTEMALALGRLNRPTYIGVDWSRSTSEIAKKRGVSIPAASAARRRLAPASLRPKAKKAPGGSNNSDEPTPTGTTARDGNNQSKDTK
jgi:DNA-binding XRE family transcriptional regulator